MSFYYLMDTDSFSISLTGTCALSANSSSEKLIFSSELGQGDMWVLQKTTVPAECELQVLFFFFSETAYQVWQFSQRCISRSYIFYIVWLKLSFKSKLEDERILPFEILVSLILPQVKFEASVADGSASLIAIDDLTFTDDFCHEVKTCTFEQDTCSWYNAELSSSAYSEEDLSVWSIVTSSYENILGPVDDVTTGTSAGNVHCENWLSEYL